MMTWQNATCKQMTWQQRRIAGRHLAHRIRGVTQDPREEPSLERMTPRPLRGSASSGWLPRGREFYARFTSRGSADVSHDDQGQAGAECRFPLWCKGGKPQARSPEESAKGFHSGATRPRPQGQQDGGHHRAHRSVMARGFSQAKTTFVRIDCTTCPLSNPAVVESLPAHIWGEDQGSYI